MVWTNFFDAHQMGVRLNFDLDVKILLCENGLRKQLLPLLEFETVEGVEISAVGRT